MFSLLSLCDLGTFPWLLLWWLLPFLLGLFLGWLLWSKYKAIAEDFENENRNLLGRVNELEDELARCHRNGKTLNNDITSLRAELRELRGAGDSSHLTAPIATATLASVSSGGDNIYAALKNDNLQLVEGIGPKMESVLKEKRIHTWSELADQSAGQLRDLLDSYGGRYRIIDPATWPAQAVLARDGKWAELITLQKGLSGGKSDNVNLTDAKVEKVLVKMGLIKKWKKDDLKAIEGIGPKIEGLLQNAGVNTWERLANTDVSRIQSILDEAGDRFKLADPGTWPRQSGMAAAGKWKELDEYQDFLQGGKE